jgi:type II secretory pathway component GspD/PulD (secretin)/tetratricopeptide (TPR) repeat protein
MTKTFSFSLAIALIAASATLTHAQVTPTDAAVTEAVRRQANTKLLREKLVAAQNAEKRKELPQAAKLYEECLALAQGVGQGVDAEMKATMTGMANVRLTLAAAAQKRGDFRAADAEVSRVLKVDPKNTQAQGFKKANDKLIAENRVFMPSNEMLDQREKWAADRGTNSTRIQDAKLLFENGKYDQAEALLAQVRAEEPDNYAAAYYSSLIKERKYANAQMDRELTSKQWVLEVEEAWRDEVSKLPAHNSYATNNLIHTSPQRQTIVTKLNRIKLDTLFYDGLPLSEVVRNLSEESKRRDPDKKGINFILSPNADTASAPALPTSVIDPATGLPVTAAPVESEPVDMGSISIKIFSPLNDLSLQDALDIIVKVADRPIKYSIENYGVIITLRAQEAVPLHSRLFKIDPNTFWMGLERVGAISFGDVETSSGGGGGGGRGGGGRGGGGGQNGQDGGTLSIPRVSVAGSAGGQNGGGGGNNGSSGGGSLFGGASLGGTGEAGGGGGGNNGNGGVGLAFITTPQGVQVIQQAVRSFFTSVGVDMTPPKAVFFNDRQGTLYVRATLQDLDIIEQAVQVLNVAPPQVNIRAKFAEVGQEDTKALGFDWYLGNVLMRNGTIGGQAGTAPSYTGSPSTANPNGFFPGTDALNTIPSSASDQILTPGLRNTANAPALFTLTGILTDPQFRMVIKALDQREGVELLSAPDVTTLSGRQAQLQVVEIRTIVTGTDLSQNSSGGGNNSVGGNSGGGVVGSTLQYTTQPLPFGPVLDVVPYVSADGFTIQMVIIPTITEFVGYDDPGGFIPQAQSVSSGAAGVGLPLTAQLPLPRFRVRQVTTTAIVWDGQTIALGGLLSESISKYKDKVPVLGDIPVVGRLFRSEGNVTEKKNLVIFVTPTIIDPAGNRVHNEENLPYNSNAIPAQRPVVTPGASASR